MRKLSSIYRYQTIPFVQDRSSVSRIRSLTDSCPFLHTASKSLQSCPLLNEATYRFTLPEHIPTRSEHGHHVHLSFPGLLIIPSSRCHAHHIKPNWRGAPGAPTHVLLESFNNLLRPSSNNDHQHSHRAKALAHSNSTYTPTYGLCL
jgi:hypothetical protein